VPHFLAEGYTACTTILLKLGWGFSSSMHTEVSSSAGIFPSPSFVAVSENQKFIIDFFCIKDQNIDKSHKNTTTRCQ